MIKYVPFIPAGSMLAHLEAVSIKEAWANLLKESNHMPYGTQENFEARGYTVEKYENDSENC